MSQKNQVLMRKCKKCEESLPTTAAGIKAHAEQCKGKLAGKSASLIVIDEAIPT